MSLSFLLTAIIFPISEITLALMKRAKKDSAVAADHGTMNLLWFTIIGSLILAIACKWIIQFRLPLMQNVSNIISIIFMVAGLIIRWLAIITLGRMFTTNVAIQNNHELVNNGIYKYLRHPSYLGLLFEFAGLGFFFSNFGSIFSLLIPITIAVIIRIKSEEKVLIKALGSSYIEYASKTKRLIPLVW